MNMDGNPYAATAIQRHALVTESGSRPTEVVTALASALQGEAILALAYEQRTANLLHALEISLRAQGVMVTVDVPAILARLGMTEPLP